jgi:hypothetical protein
MPELPIAIFVEIEAELPSGLFDEISIIQRPVFSVLEKVRLFRFSPFQKTLFLDTDTVVLEPIQELTRLLDRFDLACAHAPWRQSREIPECPESFPELNTGVILYRRSPKINRFFRTWERHFEQLDDLSTKNYPDQPAFRKSLFLSNLHFTVLPPEYNLRTPFPYYVCSKVKILHGRGDAFMKARASINDVNAPRCGNYNV